MKKWFRNTLLTMGVIGASVGLSACSNDDSKVQYRVQDGYIQSSTDGKEWKNILEIDEIRDTYSITYDYGAAESYFNNIQEDASVQDNEWLTAMPTIKDEYKNCFKGWYVTGSDKKIEEYDFIGQDVTLEARFDISNSEIMSGLYENGKMVETWQDLLDTNKVVVVNNAITDVNIFTGGELVFDESIVEIADSFLDCVIDAIVISKNITSIDEPFNNHWGNLSRIIVNEQNRKYDSRENCNAVIETATNKLVVGTYLTKIPSTVTEIGYYAFSRCEALTSIFIPKSITKIESNSFNLADVVDVVVEKGNSIYDSRDNCNAIIETATNKLVIGCKNTVIPTGITEIGPSAFRYTNLTSITIPNTVTKIDNGAFGGCYKLKSVVLPESVEETGYEVFSNCQTMESIIIPKSVTTMGGNPFIGCAMLKIFYEGNTTDKEQIEFITPENGDRDWYYYSETQPSQEGNYWHYVNDVPTKW